MKKTLFLIGMLVTSMSFAQVCCNVVDSSGETAITKNGVCISTSGVVGIACADKDGDGFLDTVDACPSIAGTLNGCPDSDGDGFADKNDNCPKVAGKLNGCPDSDGDGIADKNDNCPNVAGTLKGCPDSDGDGVADKDDKCPNMAGNVNGCPKDTDGDGVYDKDDKCINKKGSKANNGCPAHLSVEAKATLGKYAKTIQFNSGRTTFKPGVAATLDKVAKVMNQFEEINFDVEGHADSQGDDAKNMVLSQKRAQAVVDYLATHGIKGSRLHAVGYGETKPIATNKTRAGRATNRRVVLTAIE